MVENVTGPPVTAENLFGRTHEIATLWSRVQSGQNILLLAPRRVGKTSLMHELRRAPRPTWVVFYSDLERCNKPAELIADMLAHLSSDNRTRTFFDAALKYVPFRRGIAAILGRVKSFSVIEQLRVELSEEISEDWRSAALRLHERLSNTPNGMKILFIQDELPILLGKLLKSPAGRKDAEAILEWLRTLRQDPKLAGKVLFLAGGSISLSGVLRRYNLSAPINDLSLYPVGPWSAHISELFLDALGKRYSFPLSALHKREMLGLLQEFIPYHLQLMFQAVFEACRGEEANLCEETIKSAFNDRLAGPHGGPFLDHYSERLDHIFSNEDATTARSILSNVSASQNGTSIENMAIGDNFDDVVQVLIDDGYIKKDGDRLLFCSNLVRVYWLRTRAPRNV
jgi:uncharacterized protein